MDRRHRHPNVSFVVAQELAELIQRFQVANSTAQNAYRRLKQAGLVYAVKGRGVFVRQEPEPGKYHGPITNYLLREEIDREARAAATEFADLSDDELLEREAELDQRWVTVREGRGVVGAGAGLLEAHVAGDLSAHPPSWLPFCPSGDHRAVVGSTARAGSSPRTCPLWSWRSTTTRRRTYGSV
ncbi:hypothetical protein [Streptomyces sp. NPDC059895]|uniref:hypothetical protein n=1 Tax=Streptomyces sp. NPDC059895 TaxID=3346992 RepID=UPI0036618D3A